MSLYSFWQEKTIATSDSTSDKIKDPVWMGLLFVEVLFPPWFVWGLLRGREYSSTICMICKFFEDAAPPSPRLIASMRFAGLVNLTLNEGEQDKEKWNGRSWNKFRMTESKYVILAEAGIYFQNYSWIYHPFSQIYDSSHLYDSLHSLWSSFSSPVKCIVTLSRTPIYTGMTSQEYKPPICSPSLRGKPQQSSEFP